jgi:hypothetical protein
MLIIGKSDAESMYVWITGILEGRELEVISGMHGVELATETIKPGLQIHC